MPAGGKSTRVLKECEGNRRASKDGFPPVKSESWVPSLMAVIGMPARRRRAKKVATIRPPQMRRPNMSILCHLKNWRIAAAPRTASWRTHISSSSAQHFNRKRRQSSGGRSHRSRPLMLITRKIWYSRQHCYCNNTAITSHHSSSAKMPASTRSSYASTRRPCTRLKTGMRLRGRLSPSSKTRRPCWSITKCW